MGRKKENLAGQKFSMLTAIRPIGVASNNGATWLFQCECGAEKELPAARVKRGMAKSCGCARAALNVQAHIRHGHWANGKSSPEYSSWRAAKNRCYNKNNPRFTRHGGRGITICDRWLLGADGKKGFDCFIEDMGMKPSKAHSLDRIDNSGPYSPGNCRWATPKQQGRNRRNNLKIVYDRTEMPVSEAVERAGFVVSYTTALQRLKRGWAPEDAVSIPALTPGERK